MTNTPENLNKSAELIRKLAILFMDIGTLIEEGKTEEARELLEQAQQAIKNIEVILLAIEAVKIIESMSEEIENKHIDNVLPFTKQT